MEAECPLCLESKMLIKYYKCSHYCCLKCYNKWNKENKKCPTCNMYAICKYDLPTPVYYTTVNNLKNDDYEEYEIINGIETLVSINGIMLQKPIIKQYNSNNSNNVDNNLDNID